MTKLCVTLAESDTDSALAAMRSLPTGTDLVELRLDRMQAFDLSRLLAAADRPIIVTNRPAREGGGWEGDEAERLQTLRRAAKLGADYVDVELEAAAELGEIPGAARRIVSHHDFEGTPPDLEGLLRRLRNASADIAKVAVTAHDITDVMPVFHLLEAHAGKSPLIAVCMGEEGVISRILAPKFGAFLTYASRVAGREAAPGQVPVQDMLDLYRFSRIGPATDLYGVVANPVGHSMSPPVHNAAFAAEEMDAVYLPLKVSRVRPFVEQFESLDLRGLSVTIPHKETMLELMDEVDEQAARLGAVNTVAFRDGRRVGCNTDVSAAVGAIEQAAEQAGLRPLRERSVLLVGAGGGARAIAYGLSERVDRLVIANRTVERAERLAAELAVESCGLEEMLELEPDIILNATSVGMWPNVDASPVPRQMLRPGMVVFDAVYNPPRTLLLRQAEEAGAVTAPGREWFINQAVAQFEFWTGRPAPREVMAAAFDRRLSR